MTSGIVVSVQFINEGNTELFGEESRGCGCIAEDVEEEEEEEEEDEEEEDDEEEDSDFGDTGTC